MEITRYYKNYKIVAERPASHLRWQMTYRKLEDDFFFGLSQHYQDLEAGHQAVRDLIDSGKQEQADRS